MGRLGTSSFRPSRLKCNNPQVGVEGRWLGARGRGGPKSFNGEKVDVKPGEGRKLCSKGRTGNTRNQGMRRRLKSEKRSQE